MPSGKFILTGDSDSPTKDACLRFLLVLILLSVTAVAVLMGCYAFNSAREYPEGCDKQPELDPYGLSNWTRGGQVVAFGCFPGHQIEGNGEVVLSTCIDNIWVPPPPACALLPILLKCQVNQNGLEGTVSMWQTSNSTPTYIHGYLNMANVNKGQIALLETIELSRNVCVSTTDVVGDLTLPDPLPSDENRIEVRYVSAKLLAYKKAQLRITLVFIDILKHLRATVMSIHQGQQTFVLDFPVTGPTKSQSGVQGQEAETKGHEPEPKGQAGDLTEESKGNEEAVKEGTQSTEVKKLSAVQFVPKGEVTEVGASKPGQPDLGHPQAGNDPEVQDFDYDEIVLTPRQS